MTKPIANRKGTLAVGLALFSLLCGLLWGCGRKSEQGGQVAPHEGTALRGDYRTMAEHIGQLQETVRANPTDPEARRNLVAAAVDSAAHVLWATGRGLAPLGMSRPVALQAAERAALTDAYRWVALLMRWKEDYRAPDFGSVEATVPGVRIVQRDTLADEVRVLVEAPLP